MENLDWDGEGVSTDAEYHLLYLTTEKVAEIISMTELAIGECSLFPTNYQEVIISMTKLVIDACSLFPTNYQFIV